MMSLPDCGVDKIRMNDPALQSVGSLCEYVMCECVRLRVFVYVFQRKKRKKNVHFRSKRKSYNSYSESKFLNDTP